MDKFFLFLIIKVFIFVNSNKDICFLWKWLEEDRDVYDRLLIGWDCEIKDINCMDLYKVDIFFITKFTNYLET